nr:peptidoglycan-binding protein [Streptomyces sp. HNM0575]
MDATAAFAAYGQDGATDATPVRRGGGHRRRKGPGAYAYGRDQEARKRRGPARVALAAAGVVAALGAGLLTTQTLTDDDGGDDRSLSTDDTALPDLSGRPTKDPSHTEEKRSKKPSEKQSSRESSANSRAARDSSRHTDRAPVPAPPGTSSSSASSAPGTPGESDGRDGGHDQGGDHDRDRDRPRPPQDSTQPGGETLRAGDSGPEVAELQRRLKQAGALDEGAPEDGVYSQQVQQAVAQFQSWNDVRGDESGEYGPDTRRALESQTSG